MRRADFLSRYFTAFDTFTTQKISRKAAIPIVVGSIVMDSDLMLIF